VEHELHLLLDLGLLLAAHGCLVAPLRGDHHNKLWEPIPLRGVDTYVKINILTAVEQAI
jgi:hypothetical protein